MTSNVARRTVVVSSLVGLVALGLMVWSILDPRLLAHLGATSLAQLVGLGALGVYVCFALADVRRELANRD